MNWDFKIPITIVVCFMASVVSAQDPGKASFLNHAIFRYGGLERADTTEKNIYLTFTGGDFNDVDTKAKKKSN